MKSNKGYKRFGIYLTGDTLVTVYSEMGIDIMDLISEKDMTLASVSRCLNMPASTVLYNIEDLEKKNLITSYRDGVDRRQIYYSINCVMILSSLAIRNNVVVPKKAPSTESSEYSGGTFSCMMNYAFAIMMSYGMNTGYVADNFGTLIVDAMKDRFVGKSPAESMDIITNYLSESGMPGITVASMEPLVIRISLGYAVPRPMLKTLSCFMSIYCRVMWYCTGSAHSVEEMWSEDEDAVFRIVPDTVPAKPHINRDEPASIPADFLVIADRNNVLRLIDSPVQIAILRSLERAPGTLKSISSEIDFPKSTVSANIDKMKWIHAIVKERGPSGAEIYKCCCTSLISGCPKSMHDAAAIDGLFQAAVDNPRRFYESMYKYSVSSFTSIGIDPSPLQRHLGRVVMRSNPETLENASMDDVIASLCGYKSNHANWLNIESHLPLTLSSAEEYMGRIGGYEVIQFFIGCILETLHMSTGDDCVMRRHDNGITENGVPCFRIVLEPEEHFLRSLYTE